MRGKRARTLRHVAQFTPAAPRQKELLLKKVETVNVEDRSLPLNPDGTTQTRPVIVKKFQVVNTLAGQRRLYRFLKRELG